MAVTAKGLLTSSKYRVYSLYTMAVLNMRKLPEALVRRVKSQAAIQGTTMRELVSGILDKALSEMEGASKPTRGKAPRK